MSTAGPRSAIDPPEPVGHAGKDRAADHQQLPGPHVAHHLVHHPVELAHAGIEILVDRGADGDDHDLVIRERVEAGLHCQPAAREAPPQ